MTPTQAVALCRLVKAVCPAQAIDEYTPDTWHAILSHIEFDIAREAVRRLGSKVAFIAPANIVSEIGVMRRERQAAYQTAIEQTPAWLDEIDDPADHDRAYRGWLKDTRAAIDRGETPPPAEQAEPAQLPPGRMKELIAALAASKNTREAHPPRHRHKPAPREETP